MKTKLLFALSLMVTALSVFSAAAVASPAPRFASQQRLPVIGCSDLRYNMSNGWSWTTAPRRICELTGTLVGIDHARWHSWGQARATATGSFVDGLGFEYRATMTAYDLRRCLNCDGIRSPRSWYRFVHVVSEGGWRGGALRGPFDVTLFAAPERRIITLGDFVKEPRSFRVQFVTDYMTSHPDHACYGGRPTPASAAANVADPIADYRPGFDAGTGIYVSASQSIGGAIRNAEAEIGC